MNIILRGSVQIWDWVQPLKFFRTIKQFINGLDSSFGIRSVINLFTYEKLQNSKEYLYMSGFVVNCFISWLLEK